MSGLGRPMAAGAGGLVALVVLLGAAAGGALGGTVGSVVGGTGAGVAPTTSALATIPADFLALYQQAATTCPGLPWSVLAGIGQVETGQGANTNISSAGAEGPMQFLPATFAAYDQPVPPGGANPPSPFDPTDAIYAAARDLCANGARDGADIPAAVYAYNHSQAYVTQVLSYATAYAAPAPATTTTPDPAAAEAINYALAQIGTPYRWGGETPGVGFDCSGLTQGAWAAAGIAIPRTSEAQWSALPRIPLDALAPGDLVFFNPGEFIAGLPGHVGIYIGNNQFIDAPHTGATVRVENLAHWPKPFGAARPTS